MAFIYIYVYGLLKKEFENFTDIVLPKKIQNAKQI